MKSNNPYIGRFILFLGLIIAVLTISQSVIHIYLSNHEEDGTKVTLAGRQRTFLQEMIKGVLVMEKSDSDESMLKDHQEELSILFQKWENTHRALEYGNKSYQVEGENSEEVMLIFKELEPSYSAIRTSIKSILEESSSENIASDELLAAELEYEKVISRLIFQYSQEAESAASMFRLLELGLAFLMLSVIILGYVFLIRPVIKRLNFQNEELVALNQELADSGKIKSRFLANMSHEIQTPIQGILGISEWLKTTSLDREQKKSVDSIQHSAEQLGTVINGILDYSLMEAGLMKLETQAFEIRDVVEDVCEVFRVSALEKGIELNVRFDSNLPATIIQDETRLKQILTNLISNAIKFTNHGEVEIGAELVNQEAGFAQIKFSVRDTGIGLDAEQREAIFQSFTQVEDSDSREYSGLGLGLSICKDLVKLMNGHMKVESNKSGSIFWFSIITEIASADDMSLPEVTELQDKKVIVVDDNKTNLKILVRLLAGWGLRATPFNSPELVQETMDNIDKFDYVILDMQMPGIDGKELAQSIRKKFDQRKIKIIVLTSAVSDAVNDENDLFDAVIHKPVKQEVLLKTLLKLEKHESAEAVQGGLGRSQFQLPGTYKKLKVLIAEGNPLHQAVAEKTFGRLGMRTQKALSQRDMLSKLRSEDFDIVLMDAELQTENDESAIKKIRDLYPNQEDRPLILGLTHPNDKLSSELKDNADDVLSSLDLELVTDKVMHWFTED